MDEHGFVIMAHGEELSTDALLFSCLAHTPYGICSYRWARHGLAQYIHTTRAYLSGFRPAQAPHGIRLLHATMASSFMIQWQALTATTAEPPSPFRLTSLDVSPRYPREKDS